MSSCAHTDIDVLNHRCRDCGATFMGSGPLAVRGGVKIKVGGYQGRPVPPRQVGKHLWIVLAMYEVRPEADRFDLHCENLLTIEGPGCYYCEENWSQALAATPCRGNG